MMIQLQSTKKGFTLLELLAVMAIMMILATIAVTSYKSMVTGSGVGSSLSHMRQTLSLARQQAIMEGRSAFVVFYQDTNDCWYTTCLSQGTKTDGHGAGQLLVDRYNADLGDLGVGTVLFNLSSDKAKFSPVTQVSTSGIPGATALSTSDSVWTDGARYGWEISQRVRLPRGFRFVDNPPSTIRFKPNGTAVNVSGNPVGGGQYVRIFEEIRPTEEYSVVVDFSGSVKVVY